MGESCRCGRVHKTFKKNFRLGIDKRRAEWYTILSVTENEQTQDIVFLQQKRKTITEQGKEAVFRRFSLVSEFRRPKKANLTNTFCPEGGHRKMKTIIKRNGEAVPFDESKIFNDGSEHL